MQRSLGPSAHQVHSKMPLSVAQGEALLARVTTEAAGGITISVPGLWDSRRFEDD